MERGGHKHLKDRGHLEDTTGNHDRDRLLFEFTMETGEDFDGWLPSLDTNLAVEKDNTITYKYNLYEKPMSANKVLQARTAMREDAKTRCPIRRMVTTSEKFPDDVRRR